MFTRERGSRGVGVDPEVRRLSRAQAAWRARTRVCGAGDDGAAPSSVLCTAQFLLPLRLKTAARACVRWRGRASARSTRHAHPAQRLRMHICACWRCADAICLCVCADLVRVLPFMLFDMHISTSTACADPRSEPGCALTPPAPCPLPPSMTIASDVDAEGAMEESSRVCVHVHGGVCNCACAAHASDTCACRRGKALSRAELLRTPAWRRASMPPVSARVLQCD